MIAVCGSVWIELFKLHLFHKKLASYFYTKVHLIKGTTAIQVIAKMFMMKEVNGINDRRGGRKYNYEDKEDR